MRKRYGRIFLVTTAMTSSWHNAERRKVRNVADVFDNCKPYMVEAYTCRSRKVWTGLFHFRENWSHEVEFHQSW